MDDETKAELLARINVIEGIDTAPGQPVGLSYEQGGIEYRSAHCNIALLISALQEYIDGFAHWREKGNWDALKAAWLKVGLAQREMPIHVINEYCHPDRSFAPKPDFNEQSLPRSIKFYNFNNWTLAANLFPSGTSDSKGLGVYFALFRGRGKIANGWGGFRPVAWWFNTPLIDLAAVKHLNEVRDEDLRHSREHLKPTEPYQDEIRAKNLTHLQESRHPTKPYLDEVSSEDLTYLRENRNPTEPEHDLHHLDEVLGRSPEHLKPTEPERSFCCIIS
jgi:hypothetical protein